MRLVARSPATVANLGPGFDCFALALDLWNEVAVDTDAEPSVSIDGEGAEDLPRDETNLVVRSMQRLADELEQPLPPFAVACANTIPLERGLGSSAAATVAGLALANELLGAERSTKQLLQLAVEIEGHADNVAAALVGGLVIAFSTEGLWRYVRLDPGPGVHPVVLVPESERVSTADARRVLPSDVPLDDAVFNASRSALLAIALTSKPELIDRALDDRLHQQARLKLAPSAEALFTELRDRHVPVCVAGSGPTLVAFEPPGERVIDERDGWRVLRLDVSPSGLRLSAAE